MVAKLSETGRRGLEGLCRRERVRIGAGAPGIERLEAHFYGRAFAPHRHDTYAIGITLSGVQTFRYRGAARHCLPGQCHILHPDETHDGAAGTDAGFAYRILYVDPALIQEALGGRSLPFVANPVIAASALSMDFVATINDIDGTIDDLTHTDIAAIVADQLLAATGGSQRQAPLSLAALVRVRDALAASPATRLSMVALERLSGLDRWTLARQFRAAFGTSPNHYRKMRQLDQLRRLVRDGTSLAEAALAAGFADQSHMTRELQIRLRPDARALGGAVEPARAQYWNSVLTFASYHPRLRGRSDSLRQLSGRKRETNGISGKVGKLAKLLQQAKSMKHRRVDADADAVVSGFGRPDQRPGRGGRGGCLRDHQGSRRRPQDRVRPPRGRTAQGCPGEWALFAATA